MKTATRILMTLAITAMPFFVRGGIAQAQEGETTVLPAVTEQRVVIASSDENGDVGVVQFASGDGEAFTFATPMMGDFVGSSPNSLLMNKQVHEDLELTDSQKQQLKDLRGELGKAFSRQFQGSEKGHFEFSDTEDLKKTLKQIREDHAEKINSILLPHQQQRLKQIGFQMKLRRKGNSETLVSKSIAEELGLTEEQKENLKKRSEEIKKKLAEDIAKLKEEARDELFDELTRDQREKLKEMMGDKFEYKRPDFRNRLQRLRSSVEGDE